MYLGVDGGATSTKCLLLDKKGKVIGYGRGGPSNHVYGDKGIQRLRTALKDSIEGAISDAEGVEVDSAGFGMTGLKQGSRSKKIVLDLASDYLTFREASVVEDIKIALAGATTEGVGVIAYAGTGANTYGRDGQGNEVKVGGWGHIIDDKGAGYDIGRLALRSAFRSLDGRCPDTVLTEKLKDHFDCRTMRDVRDEVYKNDGLSRPEVGALAKLVYEGAEGGDRVCQNLLGEAGETLAETVTVALEKLSPIDRGFPVFRSGGVFNAGSWITEPMNDRISEQFPGVRMLEPRFPPVAGAVFVGMRELGIKPDQDFSRKLTAGLEKLSDL
jgi:N-acetylglucosamine kinase-like BadF-type ATPase